MKFRIVHHKLLFRFDAGTSRGVLREKDTWYVILWNEESPEIKGVGECGPLKGLSIDDVPEFESQLQFISENELYLDLHNPLFCKYPSIRFGFETALADLKSGGVKQIFDNSFYSGNSIPINGLIWMGEKDFMLKQISDKIKDGFSCLKMKVGALDFETEKEVLSFIRNKFGYDLVLRLDANGAFDPQDALNKLEELEKYKIHSIEQPIRHGQIEKMALLCQQSPIPVALDEELIGIYGQEKRELIETVKPPYIILKPTLLGGFAMCDEWIDCAESHNIGWWITSALESNIGLNAICQYTYEKIKEMNPMPLQGLGTGTLYHNNIESPLRIEKGSVLYDKNLSWADVLLNR